MATIHGDLSLIKDEDTLKKMWQDAEDFGQKKEIRAHMYKLREARLNELYSSEMTNEIHNFAKATKTSNISSKHADNLADHSFMSMKSKEIRDSESPTRELGFRIPDKDDHSWVIESHREQSEDGKTKTSSKIASTAGSQKLGSTKLDYAANTQHVKTLHEDGDQNNYVKSSGTSSKSETHQEASGGDEFHSFKKSSSSQSSSSSSRMVREQKSSQDFINVPAIEGTCVSVDKKVYTTSNVPQDLKNHPSYVEGHTKVTRETKTLSDGTIVTKVRYETEGIPKRSQDQSYSSQYSSSRTTNGQQNQSQTSQNYSSSHTKSSEQHISGKDDTSSKYYVEKTHNMPQTPVEVTQNGRQNHTDAQTTAQKVASSTTIHTNVYEKASRDVAEEKRSQKADKIDFESATEHKVCVDTSKKVDSTKTVPKTVPKSTTPTEGQYDTTYNTDYTSKQRISVDISPTHNAFASSLRSTSPDRASTRTSTSSLRSISPEKMRHSSRYSPDRQGRSPSPKKQQFSSSETITYTSKNKAPERRSYAGSTFSSSSKKVEESSYDSSSLTRRNNRINQELSRSRSPSPTSTTSDFEYFKTSEVTTDLDDVNLERPTTLELNSTTTRKIKKYSERSPTSPIKDLPKEVPRKSSLKYTSRKSITPSDEPPKYFDISPTDSKPGHPDNKILKRTDTYEERCKQILGLASDSTETRRSSIESIKRNSITDSRKSSLKRTSLTNEDTVKRRISKEDIGETTSSRKSSLKKTNVTTDDYVKRKASIGGVTEIQLSPDRSPERPVIQEFPSQIRRSPERKPTERYTEKISTSRYSTTVNEFSTDSAKSPERKVPEKSPEKVLSPTKKVSPVSEFQTRRSPERKTPGKYQPTSPTKKGPEICEFPSQIRRSPERKSPEKYPERATSPTKKSALINEFPSQIRRSPERKTPEKYPQKPVSPTKTAPGVGEFPSQIRRSPERKAPEKYPQSPTKKGPQFPTQTTRSPERKFTEIERAVSPTKKAPSSFLQKPLSPTKTGPKITDFPRSKSPDKFTCELIINEKITDKQSVDDVDHYDKKYISYENAVPVQEPIVLKKSIKPLGPGDVDAKFETEMLIQQKVQQNESTQKPHSVVKKQQVVTEEKKSITQKNKDQSATFIKTEKTLPKQDSRKNIQKTSEVKKFTTTKNVEVKKPAPVKKPLAEKNVNTQKHVCHKFIGATEYNTEFTKKATPVKKPVAKKVSSEKITLMDVENLNKQTVDTSVHRRTHRVDSETKIVKVPSKKNVITTKTVDIKKSPSAKKVTETRKIATVTVTPKKTTTKAGPVRTPSKPKVTKVEHTYSSDEESLMNSTDTLTTKISLEQITKKTEAKTTKTTSDQVVKPKTKAPPVRGVSKPELLTQTPRPKLEKKCLSTKSIMIHNELDLGEREILVRLEKTSRETSPLRISPVPSTTYSEDHIPRYPDRVIEPDEATSRRKPVNLSSLPIMEDGSTGNVSKIVEITENDKVDETDVSLLSVNKKISKFLRTSEDLSTKPIDVSVPAPKVDRPSFTVDKGLEKDECLLSVSDKVSKFITTAEQLTTAESLRPKSPRCQNYPSDFKKFPTAPVDETLEGDVCLLSISDKVTKFVSTAENLTKTDSSKTESKQVTSAIRRGSTPTEVPQVTTEDDTYKTPQSPTTEDKPKRRTSVQFETAKTKTEERIIENTTPKSSRRPLQEEKIILSSVGRLRSTESIKKAKALFENSTTTERELARSKDIINRPSVFSKKSVVPKRLEFGSEDEAEIKTSQDEIKLVVNKFEKRPSEKELVRRPSPERKPLSPTKAKGVSEFPSQIRRSPERKPQDKPQTRSPTRSSPSQLQEFPSQIRRTPSTDRAAPVKRTPSPTKTTPSPQLQEYPSQVRRTSSPDRKSTPESSYSSPKPASPTRRPSSPDRENPHYMAPLDRSLRNKSPHKEAVEELTTTKFGVTLRKTGSTHKVQPTFIAPKTVERKSSITFERSISEDEIESIFDLETLEHLVETVTSYEIRRRIRVQIRLVKKLIAENKLTETIRLHEMKRSSRRSSVDIERKTSFDTSSTTQTSNFTSKYSSEARKASRSPSPDRKTPDIRKTSIPQETTQPKVTTSSYTSSSRYSSHTDKSSRSSSPEKTTYTVRRTSQEVPQGKVTTSSSFSSRYSSQTDKSSRSSSPDKTTYTVRKTSFPKEPPQPKGTTSSSFTSRYSSQTDKSSRSSSPDKTTYTIRKTSIPEEITRVVEPKSTSHSSSYSSKYSTETRQSTRSTSPDKTTYSTIRKSSIPEEKVVQPKAKSPTRAGNSISKVYQTHTIKKSASQKATPVDEAPEWVRSRILKKTDKATVPTSKKSTTVTTTSKTTSSTAEERRNSTDLITSGYGCGPTDENGAPLFGLRALRSGNKTASKVQGTVVSSQYYSENGNEPVGQISVTKYSSDPTDFEPSLEAKEDRGVTSVTTTQKFGYKDSPKFGSLGKKQICDKEETSSKSSTFTRKNSVKAISQKFIDNTVESLKSERAYPKAGLILRSSSFKDEEDQGFESGATSSVTKTSSSYKTSSSTGCESFLTNKSQVTSVQDVINRMRSEDLVLEGESADDVEAKGLLNKFLGSQVILAGLEGSLQNKPTTTVKKSTQVTRTVTESGKPVTTTLKFSNPITDQELETVWDQTTLRFLLDQSTDYEERKKIRARLRQIMAEQEACTDLVTKASQEQSSGTIEEKSESRKVTTEGPVTTTQVSSRMTTQQITKKPISPFAKFRQLDKQNSLNTPPSTPKTPGGGSFFKFTDPALSQSASTIKERLLHWCRMKTKEYENIQLDNFSTSWADGLAFCALIHHFQPTAFDYHELTPKNRRHNFTLAFQVADEKADIAPLLDVDDMVATRKPDWKCVFTYVQSIYRRYKDED